MVLFSCAKGSLFPFCMHCIYIRGMEPLFSKRRLWVWPLLYFLLPWMLGTLSERFRNRWTEEWWLRSYAYADTLHIESFALNLLQPAWPLGQIPDQRIRFLVEGGKAHPDQMAWLTGRLLQMKGNDVAWVHADGHAYSFIEMVSLRDTICLDPFYRLRWEGSAEDYILREDFNKEVFQKIGSTGHVYFAVHPKASLRKVPFLPESIWVKGFTVAYAWWPWVGMDHAWVRIWSNLP